MKIVTRDVINDFLQNNRIAGYPLDKQPEVVAKCLANKSSGKKISFDKMGIRVLPDGDVLVYW